MGSAAGKCAYHEEARADLLDNLWTEILVGR